MNNARPRRRWSFVRPARSSFVLGLEVLGITCAIMLLTFLPFRYAVRQPAALQLRGNGIMLLGRQLSGEMQEMLDLRDPMGAFSSDGRSGYMSCMPGERKTLSPVRENVSFPAVFPQPPFVFRPLAERGVSPMRTPEQRPRENLPMPVTGVMMSGDGQRLGEIALPSGVSCRGGETVVRLAGGSDFPRSELLHSCGNGELDRLALRHTRKLAGQRSGFVVVLWPSGINSGKGGAK